MRKFIFFLILLFLAPKAFAQVSMNESRPDIRMLLSENSTDPNTVLFSAAEIDTAWVRALREISILAGNVVMASEKVKIDSTTNTYALNAAVTRLRGVYLFFSGDSINHPDHYLQIVDNPKQIRYLKGQTGPEYVFLNAQNLIVDPLPARTESLTVYEYRHVTIPTTASGATNLPNELLRAPIWLAASYLKNFVYQFATAEQYYKRATDLLSTYRINFGTQSLGGALPTEAEKK